MFSEILSISHNIVMGLNNVMSLHVGCNLQLINLFKLHNVQITNLIIVNKY